MNYDLVQHPLVVIKKDGYLDSKTPASANERIVTLRRTTKIAGRVVDENGNPLKDVQVTFNPQNEADVSIRGGIYRGQIELQFVIKTNQDGRFEKSALALGKSKALEILAWQAGRQPDWRLLDLSHDDVENVELVLKPGTTLRLRFDIDKGIPFPNMNFHVTFNREPRNGPSFQNLKPDENGVILLEGVPAPTPESDVVVSLSPWFPTTPGGSIDDSRRYRAEKNSYLFKYGDDSASGSSMKKPCRGINSETATILFRREVTEESPPTMIRPDDRLTDHRKQNPKFLASSRLDDKVIEILLVWS
ncbi:MAG: hypothetical protein FWC50_11395 [Planctomycetaceae bacterium]|nr:hypothetical protein [Planctomycetaceae bacterium]